LYESGGVNVHRPTAVDLGDFHLVRVAVVQDALAHPAAHPLQVRDGKVRTLRSRDLNPTKEKNTLNHSLTLWSSSTHKKTLLRYDTF
jgi:hypothetical protein